MTVLAEALAELERMTAFRLRAESVAGSGWRDVVFRALERKALDPLATEERRFIDSTQRLDDALSRALTRLAE